METVNTENVAAVDAAPVTEAKPVEPVEQVVVEEAPKVEGVVEQGENSESVDKKEAPVEAKAVDAGAAGEAVVASVAPQAVEAVDPRSEFKKFVASFGDKASAYYAQGLTYEAATVKFASDMKSEALAAKAEAADLKKQLAASLSGRETALSFRDDEGHPVTAKKTLADMIVMAGATKRKGK